LVYLGVSSGVHLFIPPSNRFSVRRKTNQFLSRIYPFILDNVPICSQTFSLICLSFFSQFLDFQIANNPFHLDSLKLDKLKLIVPSTCWLLWGFFYVGGTMGWCATGVVGENCLYKDCVCNKSWKWKNAANRNTK
jgi:hypothetical protein